MYDLIIVAVHSACINGVGGYWECKKFKLAEVDGKHLAGVTGAELKPLAPRRAKTAVSIRGESFYVNGEITSARKTYRGASVEGLLFNSRMVNAVFDDLNTESRPIWAYPDTGLWDPERNTREFVAAMSDYAAHGLQAVTVSLQGGSPCGNNPADDHPPCGDMYNRDSSSFAFDGRLRANAFRRMGSIIEKADALGMVVFMQLFYPDIAWRIFDSNNGAVLAAADNTVDWLVAHNYTNVVLDVCNECDLCRIAGADTIDSVRPHSPPTVCCSVVAAHCGTCSGSSVLTSALSLSAPTCGRYARRLDALCTPSTGRHSATMAPSSSVSEREPRRVALRC